MFGPRDYRGLNHARYDTGFGWAVFFYARGGCCKPLIFVVVDLRRYGPDRQKLKPESLNLPFTFRAINSDVKQKRVHVRVQNGRGRMQDWYADVFFYDGRPSCLLYVKPLHARPRLV